jgi:hypothetical protein
MSKKRRHQKFVSAAVRVANQANAQLSTGPRTEAGKAVAAMNARKHGLTAKHFVIAPGEEAIFEAFRNAVVEDIQPRTETEWMFFEDILTGRWNMRRVDLAEVHLFQATGFDPLRNPDPEIEKRYKRLMSYRRMWQRTSDKAYAEIQRRRDYEAELATQQAETTPKPGPEGDLQKRSQIDASTHEINNIEVLAEPRDESESHAADCQPEVPPTIARP